VGTQLRHPKMTKTFRYLSGMEPASDTAFDRTRVGGGSPLRLLHGQIGVRSLSGNLRSLPEPTQQLGGGLSLSPLARRGDRTEWRRIDELLMADSRAESEARAVVRCQCEDDPGRRRLTLRCTTVRTSFGRSQTAGGGKRRFPLRGRWDGRPLCETILLPKRRPNPAKHRPAPHDAAA
jgi:hypothetical protein